MKSNLIIPFRNDQFRASFNEPTCLSEPAMALQTQLTSGEILETFIDVLNDALKFLQKVQLITR